MASTSRSDRAWRTAIFVIGSLMLIGLCGKIQDDLTEVQEATTSETSKAAAASDPGDNTPPDASPGPSSYTPMRDRVVYRIVEEMGNDDLRGVSVERTEAGYDLAVDFEAGDNFTRNMIRLGIVDDAKRIIEIMSTDAQFDSIEVYRLTPYFPIVDDFGNESVQAVGRIVLRREVARRINWDNMTSRRFEALLGREGSFSLHPDLKE